MSNGRHSYIAFYPSDWNGGTGRMPRLHRSVFFDICCFNWDHFRSCSIDEQSLMLSDVNGWENVVNDLVAARKLIRNDDGSVENQRAMIEAEKSYNLWKKKSDGGKAAALTKASSKTKSRVLMDSCKTQSLEPEPEPEPEPERKKVTAKAAPIYEFEGEVIKLERAHYERWKRAYPDIDLRAQLQSRDDWLATEAEGTARQKWFISTSNFLARLQAQATEKANEPVWDSPC